ncbi:MAG: GAF domain-containing protein, partial [Anaerolineae bacterium]|nr:GAF domain-containing protein [Anaerolineae bacterium]
SMAGAGLTAADTPAVTAFANQMAIAIENTQLYQMERKRTAHLAVVNQVARRAASILDMDHLLQEVVTAIEQGFNYHNVALSLLDEAAGELEVRAIAGGFADLVSPDYRQAVGIGMVGWVAETSQPLLANDVSQEPHYILGFLEEPLTKAELCVPLKLAGQVIGVLDVEDIQLNAFDETDLLAMETLADQLAIAIENARLYQQTDEKLQTRVKELSALYAIAEAVNHSLDLDKVLQLALDSAIEVTGMDSGGILLLDPSTSELFLRAHRGGSPEFIRAVGHIKADEGLMPRMLDAVLTIDELSKVSEERRMAIEKEGLQCLFSIPIKAKESLLGVMVIASRSPRPFTSQELELLATIGNQVGVAVDRAHLQAQKLRAAVLAERQDMARQIHDDTAQTLGYLGLQVDSVMGNPSLAQNVKVQAELEGIRKAIEDAYERVRSSIIRLGEDIPDHFDLETALPEIISEFEKQTRCRVESKVEGSQLPRLPPAVALQAIYIIREALTNVRKHSGATSVHLTLQGLEDGRIKVTIQDNGRGFDLDSNQQAEWRGLGLRFMRERAERVGGSLRIESQPGQGTRVVVSLPSG